MVKPTWVPTLATQLLLCFALYLVLNIGQHQPIKYATTNGRRALHLYFISVTGGFRPLNHQTLLLKQQTYTITMLLRLEFGTSKFDWAVEVLKIEKTIKTYKARFVINISELGEDDPLMHNATLFFRSKIPWYPIRGNKSPQVGYIVKRIKIPYGKNLDVIALNTGSRQDSSNGTANDHLKWLTRTLEASSSNWRIVAGFHPFAASNENTERNETRNSSEPLHQLFLKQGVDAYLSCADQMGKGPYFMTSDKTFVTHNEMDNGLLLHRVSSLEIVTYLVSLKGEVLNRISIQQRGKEDM